MIGIGIDAVEVERFRRVLARRPSIVTRIFRPEEIDGMRSRVDPVPGLAARFAAKEATMKALGAGIGSLRFRDIEVTRAPSGAPGVVVHGSARKRSEELGVATILVSLSHTESIASAVAFAEGRSQGTRT